MAARAERQTARLIPTGETGAARVDARSAIDAIGERLRSPGAAEAPGGAAVRTEPGRVAAAGDRVLVGPFGLEGIVRSVHDRDAEVDVRGKRLRAKLDDLRVVTPAATLTAQPARVHVNVDLQPREGPLTELNVIGCTVDEALARGRALPGRSRGGRVQVGPPDSRLRHRAVAPLDRDLPPVAAVRRALRAGATGTRRGRGHGRRVQGVRASREPPQPWPYSPRRSSTT